MQDVKSCAEELSDEQLCQLLDDHLHIDARPYFAAAATPVPIEHKQAAKHHQVLLLKDHALKLHKDNLQTLRNKHCLYSKDWMTLGVHVSLSFLQRVVVLSATKCLL